MTAQTKVSILGWTLVAFIVGFGWLTFNLVLDEHYIARAYENHLVVEYTRDCVPKNDRGCEQSAQQRAKSQVEAAKRK